MRFFPIFFGQNKGIKQHMDKIELHPAITICPFQDQCVRPIILRLKGKPKELYSQYEGSYQILSSDLFNGKPYWTHNDRNKYYVYYNYGYKRWMVEPDDKIISDLSYLGETPFESTTWYYWSNGTYISTTTDVVVEGGKTNSTKILLNCNQTEKCRHR